MAVRAGSMRCKETLRPGDIRMWGATSSGRFAVRAARAAHELIRPNSWRTTQKRGTPRRVPLVRQRECVFKTVRPKTLLGRTAGVTHLPLAGGRDSAKRIIVARVPVSLSASADRHCLNVKRLAGGRTSLK